MSEYLDRPAREPAQVASDLLLKAHDQAAIGNYQNAIDLVRMSRDLAVWLKYKKPTINRVDNLIKKLERRANERNATNA